MKAKEAYYKLDKKEFESWLNQRKCKEDTLNISFRNGESYFFVYDHEIMDAILEISKSQICFEQLFSQCSPFVQRQLVTSYFIDEIQQTNAIENIVTTKHDVFMTMNHMKNKESKKILSTVLSYQSMLGKALPRLDAFEDIRTLYDAMIKDTLDKYDIPEGMYFRKNPVYVSDGMKSIHKGFYPEKMIEEGMNEFLKIYNESWLNDYIALCISHYIFEIVHPFYDGNGRFGRFLFSLGLFQRTKSYFSFCISSSIGTEKKKYYSAFKNAEDIHNYGELNGFVESMLSILKDGMEKRIKELQDGIKNEEEIYDLLCFRYAFTKKEKEIIKLLIESKLYSYCGVSHEEIMKECGVSKRTLQYFIKKYEFLLKKEKTGKFVYLSFNECLKN